MKANSKFTDSYKKVTYNFFDYLLELEQSLAPRPMQGATRSHYNDGAKYVRRGKQIPNILKYITSIK